MSGRVVTGDQRRTLALVVAALVLAVVAAVAAPGTFGRFNEQVVNPTNTAATGIFPTCQSTTIVGSPFFIYPLNDASGSTVADTSTPARTGTYRGAPIGYRAAGPCGLDAGTGVNLNLPVTATTGNAFLSGPNGSVTAPGTFSVGIWFRTNSARGGRMIGFGNATGTAESTANYDRHLYLSNAGKVVWGVSSSTSVKNTVSSATGFNDNTWHHAVGTFSPGAGMRLYVDGALVANNAAANTTTNYTGFWRIGWDNLAGWPETRTSEYYQGSLSWASVHTSQLGAAQVGAIWDAGK